MIPPEFEAADGNFLVRLGEDRLEIHLLDHATQFHGTWPLPPGDVLFLAKTCLEFLAERNTGGAGKDERYP